MDIMAILEQVRKDNPYPADIFLERSGADWNRLHKLCNDNGLCLDGYNGSLGRFVWNACIDAIEQAMREDGDKNE